MSDDNNDNKPEDDFDLEAMAEKTKAFAEIGKAQREFGDNLLNTFGHDDDDDDEKKKKPAADRLIDLITQNSNVFFKDQYGSAHASIYDKDHHRVFRVSSGPFKRYLIMAFHDAEQKIINAETVTNVVNYLQARAESRGQTYPLSVRVAKHNEDFYYDMTDEKWQSVKINREGWQ
jgi:hypothetical protein